MIGVRCSPRPSSSAEPASLAPPAPRARTTLTRSTVTASSAASTGSTLPRRGGGASLRANWPRATVPHRRSSRPKPRSKRSVSALFDFHSLGSPPICRPVLWARSRSSLRVRTTPSMTISNRAPVITLVQRSRQRAQGVPPVPRSSSATSGREPRSTRRRDEVGGARCLSRVPRLRRD